MKMINKSKAAGAVAAALSGGLALSVAHAVSSNIVMDRFYIDDVSFRPTISHGYWLCVACRDDIGNAMLQGSPGGTSELMRFINGKVSETVFKDRPDAGWKSGDVIYICDGASCVKMRYQSFGGFKVDDILQDPGYKYRNSVDADRSGVSAYSGVILTDGYGPCSSQNSEGYWETTTEVYEEVVYTQDPTGATPDRIEVFMREFISAVEFVPTGMHC